MKRLCLLVLLLAPGLALCQDTHECIAFAPASSDSVTNLARDPLATAVTLSGDFRFYPRAHFECWQVHVLSIPVTVVGGEGGYAVSYTVTDLGGVEVGFGLQVGPDRDTFDRAMREAAKDAITDIRFKRKLNENK
jgi:hypothetical protein